MVSFSCFLCVFLGFFGVSLVFGQECTVALQLQPELTDIAVGGALKTPLPAPLFADSPPVTLEGSIAIVMSGVECPQNLEEIGDTMSAATSISFVSGMLPALVTIPDTISTSVLGLADLELSGLTVDMSNDMVSYSDGLVSAPQTLFNITEGEVFITSQLISDLTQPLDGFGANSDLTGTLDGAQLVFNDVSIVVPVETVEQGVAVSADVTLDGSVGGEIVPFAA